MAGISRIVSQREAFRNPTREDQLPRKEIWFKDGDQAFITPVATGNENDDRLDDIYMYTYRADKSSNRWTNLLKDDSVDTSMVPENIRPSHKFAFWGFVHEIIHADRRQESWTEIECPGGKRMFREEVNDFKVIALSFGRSDYIWNQLVDVYNDWGTLDKGVVRIKRTGTGLYDTSYQIAATARDEELPSDKLQEIGDLQSIQAYYKERYSGTPEVSMNGTSPLYSDKESKEEALF